MTRTDLDKLTLKSTDPQLQAVYRQAQQADPRPHRLRDEGQVVFTGGRYGDHALNLSVSSAERIVAHWEGYCERNGARACRGIVRVRATAAQIAALQEPLQWFTSDADEDKDALAEAVLDRMGKTYVDVDLDNEAELELLATALQAWEEYLDQDWECPPIGGYRHYEYLPQQQAFGLARKQQAREGMERALARAGCWR